MLKRITIKAVQSVLSILFVSGSFICLAQEQKPDFDSYLPKKFFTELELYGGPAVSFFRGNKSVESVDQRKRALKVGYSYGIGILHPISERLSINGKFLFERKGGVINKTSTYFDEPTQTYIHEEVKEEYLYDYLTLPISLEYGFTKRNNFKVGFGVFTGYLIKQFRMETNELNTTISRNDETEYNTDFDFGLSTSIGYRVAINTRFSVNFQLLNTLGLVNTRLNLTDGVMKSNNTSLLIGLILDR